jgi:membrane protein DedA with SNARE-associated domain
VQSLLDWLAQIPPIALYGILLVAAFVENIFPPFPSDVVVAFGGFVLSRTPHGTVLGALLPVWIGNVGGAMLIYALGRRYGARRLEERLAGKHAASRDDTLRRMFDRFGLPAVFVSRFVPGVRAVVPAFAGALRLPVVWIVIMIGTASALWYGMITVVAFRIGSDWERLQAITKQFGTTAAVIGGAVLVLGVVAWLIVQKRRKTA